MRLCPLCRRRWPVLLLLLLLLLVSGAGSEAVEFTEELLEKDLYKTLGVSSTASPAEIKKAFRTLAKTHHPDKVAPAQREINAALFRDIASSYEVLSNNDSRRQYDEERRALLSRRKHVEEARKQRYRYQQQEQEQRQQWQELEKQQLGEWERQWMQRQMQWQEELMQWQEEQERYSRGGGFDDYDDDDLGGGGGFGAGGAGQESYSRQGPVVTGSIIRSGQVLFPLNPILSTADGHFFAFLDSHCALGVYSGSLDAVLLHIYTHQSLDLTNLPVELLFRTPGEPSLRGKCFAALDDHGVLSVFVGHPDMDYRPIWSSPSPKADDTERYTTFFTTYVVELSSSGELAVLSLRTGNSEAECVWSTTSCNLYLALLQDVKLESVRIIKSGLSVLIGGIKAALKFFDDVLLSEHPWQALQTGAFLLVERVGAFAKSKLREFL